jgi:hypothetical protein
LSDDALLDSLSTEDLNGERDERNIAPEKSSFDLKLAYRALIRGFIRSKSLQNGENTSKTEKGIREFE